MAEISCELFGTGTLEYWLSKKINTERFTKAKKY